MDFQRQLKTEKVDQAGVYDSQRVALDQSVREVLEIMKEDHSGSVLVCQDKQLLGIFTERDALRIMANGTELDQPIENVMSRDPVTLSAEDSVGDAIEKMASGGYRRLPIVNDDGQPVGMLKVSGILHYLVDHFAKVIYNLPPEPHHSTQNREGA